MNASDARTEPDHRDGAEPDVGPADRPRLRQVALEHGALRRIATLVARGAQPPDVFGAVANELGHLIGAEAAFLARVDLSRAARPEVPEADKSPERSEPEGYATVVGSCGRVSDQVPIGFQAKLHPGMVTAIALRAGCPVRINGERLANGPSGSIFGGLGLRAVVAMPIVAEGSPWGVAVAATSREDFPAGADSRMADFMGLAATAIASAQAVQKLHDLAETQESLRRLAALVARGERPEALFAAATREALRHFGSGTARMIRYETNGMATLLANEGTTGPHVRVGERWEGYPPTGLTATVLHTGQAARVDDYRDVPGGQPYLDEGLLSAVAMPVRVNGRLWGMIAVGSGQGPLPPDTEQRMTEFTDLLATAIANAQSRTELMDSRSRLVAASDVARRRIERDLHDGAQQRLVTLGLQLRSAAAAAPAGFEEIRAEIDDVADGLTDVVGNLREISHGIHPAILSEAGLRSALRSLARRSAIPVDLDLQVGGRLPELVEVTAYYVISEMLANAVKHADASALAVTAELADGSLRVCTQDDGIGGADPARGSGLVGLRDRVEAIGGTFAVDSPAGHGTTSWSVLPLTR
jgi:signal transduction histidine kinase